MNSILNIFDKQRPVLVIDDCPIYRTAAKGMLQKLGFSAEQIHVAKEPRGALSISQKQPFQLVLCDYNLGNHKNGHQLLDEMIFNQVLPADCVLIIVTGDASAEVVRGFAELEPDGYLVKPLNFKTLSQRLPKMGRRKRLLGQLLTSYARGEYTSTIEQAEEALYKAAEMASCAQLLKARALIKLDQLDEARNLLITLQQGPDQQQVSMELARIALRQKQYPLCQSLLNPLEADPIHCGAALQLSAEQLLQQQQLPLALEKVNESASKSPKNIERHLLKTYIAMAMFDLCTAAHAAQFAVKQAKFSFRETIDLHQLAAKLQLDRAQFAEPGKKLKILGSFTQQCMEWRQTFARHEYKYYELLLMARANGIRGFISKARDFHHEYQQLCTQNPDHQPSTYEQLELAKVKLILSDKEGYEALMSSVLNQLRATRPSNEELALVRYISNWRQRVERMSSKASQLKKLSLHYMKEANYDKAIEQLIQALELDRADSDISRHLMVSLTKVWPIGWSRKQVRDLAMHCKDLLIHTPVINSAEFKRCCQTLASQLQLRELEITETDTVAIK